MRSAKTSIMSDNCHGPRVVRDVCNASGVPSKEHDPYFSKSLGKINWKGEIRGSFQQKGVCRDVPDNEKIKENIRSWMMAGDKRLIKLLP